MPDVQGVRDGAEVTTTPLDHELKCWPVYFQAIWNRSKKFELRRYDRTFLVGDIIKLREYVPSASNNGVGIYSGRSIVIKVTYLLLGGIFGLDADYCILSFTVKQRRLGDCR